MCFNYLHSSLLPAGITFLLTDHIWPADELIARLVVVPCSQEARGLDAGPRLVQRLMSASDHRTAAIVQKISDEELAHVAVGAFVFCILELSAS